MVLEGEAIFSGRTGASLAASYARAGCSRALHHTIERTVREVAHYRNNQLHGETIRYDESGRVKERLCFDTGQPVPCPKEPAPRR